MNAKCPLCENKNSIDPYYLKPKGNKFQYFKCSNCKLVFLDRKEHLDPEIEKSRYEMHENNERSTGYEDFLNQLINPMLKRVSKSQSGLDYGSGPYPMLAELVKERGYKIETYDPFFDNEDKHQKLSTKYDYITCCEVAEHFYNPQLEFKHFKNLLNNGGILGVRTNLLYPEIDFKSWHYKEDDTHVSFYSPETVEWICKHFGFNLVYIHQNVFIIENKPIL